MVFAVLRGVLSLPALGVAVLLVVAYLATQAWQNSRIKADVAKELSYVEERLDKLRVGQTVVVSPGDENVTLQPANVTSSVTTEPARKVVRVAWLNTLVGGSDGRLTLIEAWLASVRPDVVGLSECNGWDAAKAKATAARWGHQHSVFARAESGYHVVLTSRLAMRNVSVLTEGFRHAAIGATLENGLRVIVTHLRPESGDLRVKEAEILPLGAENEPLLVIGDLNSLSSLDAEAYKQTKLGHIGEKVLGDVKDTKLRQKFTFGGKLDFRVLDLLYSRGLRDLVFESIGATFSVGGGAAVKFSPSVPTKLEQELDFMNNDHAMRLDYVLGRNVVVAGRCDVVRDVATAKLSDHYPVMCEIELKR